MTIIEATKQAMEKNCGMTRPYRGHVFGYVKPTNGSLSHYILVGLDSDGNLDGHANKFWNPTADDILADNWELFEEE
ncbi:DUF2829 domain-containing protein [Fructilactobacillus cliffordii]|uniref:DUF2829 domain-containing protein n=1 Tax=Fructilactobacillus cliffordii TaxID=2940299 RepID=UPI002093E8DE|nr:DUF2829 domain-containing protein [Fructilactobacillus cliffordii]USS86457.1 DUF2829 domain-containing protein [Fructilactobacillus cliffordii]